MKLKSKAVCLLMAGGLFMTSCGSGTNESETSDTTLAADSMQADMAGNPEQDFIKDAVEMNTRELAWLDAGMKMGMDNEVKGHAKMMMADHEQMGTEVKDYAGKKGLEVPNVDTAGEVDINEKTGKDWDRKWAEKMVDDHQKVIKRFENAQNDVKDEELRTMITSTLPKLRSHLEMSEKLRDKLSK